MNKMNNSIDMNVNPDFYVVHPLFDKPEEKLNPDSVGTMKMTKSVKYSLMALRVYLILMIGMAFYRTLTMGGILH